MSDVLAGYRCLTPFQTAGSGSARWCIAQRDGERYFVKEFLSPVYPAQPHTPLGQRQLERCRQFERRKQRLYAASSCVLGDVLVPVIDFFRIDGHYYAVSEALTAECMMTEKTAQWSEGEKRAILYQLALCLQRLHAQGVVHGDLKPEHVLLVRQSEGWKVRLIDLDSGFLTETPPDEERAMEGDPAYLAPEMFLRMVGESAALGTAIDVFAFAAIIHQLWTGKLPMFDHERYHYLYEAALDGGQIHLDLPGEWRDAVGAMLCYAPDKRPADAEITALFAPGLAAGSMRPKAANGLKRLMRA